MHATHARLDALSNLLEDVLRCFNDAVQPLCKAGGLGSCAARRLDIEAIEQGIQLLLLHPYRHRSYMISQRFMS